MKKSAAERTIGEEEVLRAEESGVYKRHPAVIAVRSFVYSVILSAFIYELVRVGKGGEVTMRLFSPLIASACLGVIELIEKAGRIRMPAYLDIAAHLFVCGCLPLGSTYAFYSVVPGWDKLLHTFSGFVFYFSGLCIGGLLAGKAEGRRRVAIVRALLADAPLVLMDEPFKGLDAATRDSAIRFARAHLAGGARL